MAERSSAGMVHALREGIARAASARGLLVSVYAAARLLELPTDDTSLDLSVRPAILSLLFWAVVFSGTLDRYARNRPTRVTGFFAACGRHVMPMVRLGVVVVLVEFALLSIHFDLRAESLGVQAGESLLMLVLGTTLTYTRVRLVVEDRRSVFGALLGAVRFVRRNPASFVIAAVYTLLGFAVVYVYGEIGGRLEGPYWLVRVSYEAVAALQLFVQLAAYASAVVLFQSRLAHASYTAAPPALWPDSPAAEAITNAAPVIAP